MKITAVESAVVSIPLQNQPPVNGIIPVTQRPGHGVKLDDRAVERYLVE